MASKREALRRRMSELLERFDEFVDCEQAIDPHTLPSQFDDLKAIAVTRLALVRMIANLGRSER